VTKFLPLADMDIKQPMIVIALADHASSVGVLKGLEGLGKYMRDTFDVIQSCSGTEWFILMVPAGAGKGSAALHVASRLGFAADQMMVAGDGENDLPLFEITHTGVRGVVVNNACARLKQWKEKEAPWTVVQAEQGNAGGILEGLWRHFRHHGYSHRAASASWLPSLRATQPPTELPLVSTLGVSASAQTESEANVSAEMAAVSDSGSCSPPPATIAQGQQGAAALLADPPSSAAAEGVTEAALEDTNTQASQADLAHSIDGQDTGNGGLARLASDACQAPAVEAADTSGQRTAAVSVIPDRSGEGDGGWDSKSGEITQLTYGAPVEDGTHSQTESLGKSEVNNGCKSSSAVSAWDEWLTDALGKGIKGLGQKLRGGREAATTPASSGDARSRDANSAATVTAFATPLSAVTSTDTSKSVSTSANPSTNAITKTSIPTRAATTSSFAQDLARKVALLEERVGAMAHMAHAVLLPRGPKVDGKANEKDGAGANAP